MQVREAGLLRGVQDGGKCDSKRETAQELEEKMESRIGRKLQCGVEGLEPERGLVRC